MGKSNVFKLGLNMSTMGEAFIYIKKKGYAFPKSRSYNRNSLLTSCMKYHEISFMSEEYLKAVG